MYGNVHKQVINTTYVNSVNSDNMSEVIGIRVTKEQAQQYRDKCKTLNIDPTEFLRGALLELTTNPESTTMLQCMGFHETNGWTYNPTAK